MPKLNVIDFNIDEVQDGIQFSMQVYNFGKYDKEQLKTIVRNTALKIGLKNTQNLPVLIDFIGVGIKLNGLVKSIHFSSKQESYFPYNLNTDDEIEIKYYAYSIKKILAHTRGESFFILASSSKGNQNYISNSINGDELEALIIQLEDEEISNWGYKEFLSLDKELLIK